MNKPTNIRIKYPEAKKAILNCEECGQRAEVLSMYGHYERHLCASCFVRAELPKVQITMTAGNADFDEAWIGSSYCITGFEYDEFEPYDYGFKDCKFLKEIADRIICIGEREDHGKRSKQLKIELKPEYKAMIDDGGWARYLSNRTFTPTTIARTKHDVKRLLEEAGK